MPGLRGHEQLPCVEAACQEIWYRQPPPTMTGDEMQTRCGSGGEGGRVATSSDVCYN